MNNRFYCYWCETKLSKDKVKKYTDLGALRCRTCKSVVSDLDKLKKGKYE